ncbi:GTP-binding protein 2 [Paramyrothecium foliicola]|nr:GTP-binding protein 2 [Paramyrothecium foliicola]
MASVFTYDPDPPRVSSPWLAPEDSDQNFTKNSSHDPADARHGLLSEYGVTKLQAEPQDGPTEYKLHLLLRPRRAYKSMSTTSRSKTSARASTPSPAASSQPRQQRLQHLTTQLLWRLQQSSPYHASSSKELTIPKLPDDSVDLNSPILPEALVPGLEESRGALYEIGVSDDGTLVGLTKDEMDESIATLRIMAASLGCSVEIVRMIIVGDCEWIEFAELVDDAFSTPTNVTRHGRLWVAEAFVTPNLGQRNDMHLSSHGSSGARNETQPSSDSAPSQTVAIPSQGSSTIPQLRVTFTGPTTSGKTSLLGTLSTGTLDNGRGKSRLSLFKHRHEMVSGITSSIAQELIGYKERAILNFSHGNIESWTDIHDFAEQGRLVFVTDSGGHPRYRRTVLRGLMNWAPHWGVLCLPADDGQDVIERDSSFSTPSGLPESSTVPIDLMDAHLKLSLKLDVPLAVVVTKLDLASKASLQKTMVKVLTAVKEAGRIPRILQPDQRQAYSLHEISSEDHEKVQSIVKDMHEGESLTKYVPIVLTSAVKGTGIGLLHALMESLPMPPAPTARDFVGHVLNPEQPKCLFHIDDTFSLPASYSNLAQESDRCGSQGVIVSGHLRFGDLSVGGTIVVGPFPAEDEDTRGYTPADRPSPSSYGLSISHPSSAELARIAMKNAVSASSIAGEWHKARVVSIRNLRLPVRTLEAGQAGSIGLVFESESEVDVQPLRIRRGMVLAIPSKHMLDTGLSLQAASGFTATFSDTTVGSLAIGSFVNVYVASVRAAARVAGISRLPRHDLNHTTGDDVDEIFTLSGDTDETVPNGGADVFLELLHNREWVELGSKVMLLEGGSQDKSGLEGYVGRIVEIVE